MYIRRTFSSPLSYNFFHLIQYLELLSVKKILNRNIRHIFRNVNPALFGFKTVIYLRLRIFALVRHHSLTYISDGNSSATFLNIYQENLWGIFRQEYFCRHSLADYSLANFLYICARKALGNILPRMFYRLSRQQRVVWRP